MQTLLDFKFQKLISAENGQRGGPNKCTGASGKDTVLKVPCGTEVRHLSTNIILGDLTNKGQQLIVAFGGKGGFGNARYLSNSNRAPEKFTEGKEGEEWSLQLELKLLAEVGIIGLPNAGKSTLLNVLLEEDRAIVSANPGTTRDILEADIVHNGRRIIFYDTAGLRSTKGKVEAEGVKRAKDKAEFSDVVIILVEKKDFYKNQNIIDEFFNFVPRGKRFVVASKSDLFDKDIDLPLNSHVISSKTRFGINSLLDKICEFSNVDIESDFAEGVLTTERQVSLLNEGLVSLRASKGLFEDDAYFEIVSIEIREFINSISDITGEVSNNDIYDKLFSSFCIGK